MAKRTMKAQETKPVVVLSKEAILAAEDLPSALVPVPEWGGHVKVQAMTGTERDAWESELIDQKGNIVRRDNARARLLCRCIVNENNELMFDEADIELLGAKSAKALDRVFATCQKLNGITAEDIDDLVGNSSEGQDDASSSD